MLLVGLMSGTSADGIDAALVEIVGSGPSFSCSLLAHAQTPYRREFRDQLLRAASGEPVGAQDYCLLHAALGERLGDAARQEIARSGHPPREIAAVCSHGHTIWHQPKPATVSGTLYRGSLQIGCPARISARTGCRVISDFRSADMAAGGQGAPLVPLADWLLFRSEKESRAVLNLGGIANVTYLPKGADRNEVIAFDTGPANMAIDEVCSLLTRGNLRFDRDGEWAKRGEPNEEVLREILADPWFSEPPPKSTGRERFGRPFAEALADTVSKAGGCDADIVATATALAARSVGNAFRAFLGAQEGVATVIASGGGIYNGTLMASIRRELAPARVMAPENFGLQNRAKEAVAFAILGYETLHGRPGNLPSATGAKRAVILGSVTEAPDPNSSRG